MSEHILNELQLLTAMYDPADIHFHDPEILSLVENCIQIFESVSFVVQLNESVKLDIWLPFGYPETERLSAYCRLSKKSPGFTLERNSVQKWESQFNNELCQRLETHKKEHCGDDKSVKEKMLPNILDVIQWCNEQIEKYPIPTEKMGNFSSENKPNISDSGSCCRIWIFSHHIYNKNKRKFLVNTADELNLAGFSLPGKPGFICVEGDPENCDEYWSRVRQLSWQKISLIERQTFPSAEIIYGLKPFEELHCDKSEFIKFLEEKNASFIIKDYLGI